MPGRPSPLLCWSAGRRLQTATALGAGAGVGAGTLSRLFRAAAGAFAAFSGGGLRGFTHGGGAVSSFHRPSVAFGGGSYNSRGYGYGSGGNGNYGYGFGSHRGWSRGHEYAWHGHHYRWYNGSWFIVDPYPYDAVYPYYDSYEPGYTVYGAPEDESGPMNVPMQVQQELGSRRLLSRAD